MKHHLILLVCGYILLFISIPATATIVNNSTQTYSDFAVIDLPQFQWQMDSEGLERLYLDFEQHFGPYIAEGHKVVDYSFVMSKDTSFETFTLMRRLHLAMEEGLPLASLKRFKRFGVIIDKDGRYSIDYQVAPHLADAQRLFALTSTSKMMMSQYLLKRGFRQSDVDIIYDYVLTNDISQASDSAYYQFYLSQQTELQQLVWQRFALSKQAITQQIMSLSFAVSAIDYQSKRNWAIGLMNRLDKQRQRILAKVLIESINGVLEGSNKPHDLVNQYLLKLEHGLVAQKLAEFEQRLEEKSALGEVK